MATEIANLARLVANTGARRGIAVEVREGEAIEVVDVRGKQTAVLIAFNQHDVNEALSPAVTRGRLSGIMLQLNNRLYSNLGRPMVTLEADTVGRHDLLLPAFDQTYFDEVYSAPGHDNCRANLYLAVREWGIAYHDLPDPVTFFANISIRQRGELEFRAPLSEPGDLVRLRAHMDLIVAVSASPQDRNALNDYAPSELLLRVLPKPA